MLSIDDYNAAERAARKQLSSRAIEAYSPVTFSDTNYPLHVDSEAELLRYADTMHETNDGMYFDGNRYRYSQTEGAIISQVAEAVASMTQNHFERRVRPWMAPFGAVPALRIIEAFKTLSDAPHLKVLELGPGSGYLGALLNARGHSYAAMDITQGFYLWQNRLLSALAQDDFHDWATHSGQITDWSARVNHLAWWQWATQDWATVLRSDVIVCDHALGEFHPIALRHALRLIRIILQGNGPKLFFFTSPGAQHFSDLDAIGRACLQSGLELLFFKNFFGFTVPESSLSQYTIKNNHVFKTRPKHKVMRLLSPLRSNLSGHPLHALEHDIPFVDHQDGAPTLGGAEIIPLIKAEEPMDYPFLGMAGFKSPLDIVG